MVPELVEGQSLTCGVLSARSLSLSKGVERSKSGRVRRLR